MVVEGKALRDAEILYSNDTKQCDVVGTKYFESSTFGTLFRIDSVGILAVANKFPMLLTMVYGVFTYSWQISVLEEFKSEGYKMFYNRIFRILLVVLYSFH